MSSLFLRQFCALLWKNWIVLARHPLLNLIRCFILPIAYGIFLAVAQSFFNKPSNFGIGQPVAIQELSHNFDGSLSLVWADATNGQGFPNAAAIMARVTQGISTPSSVKQVSSPTDIAAACPQNFNLFSECFAAIAFNSLPSAGQSEIPVNYTISADAGLYHIDVVKHKSDYEKRILPLQWALDKAIIELRTGVSMQTPLELPFNQETNEEQDTDTRLSYIRGLRTLLVLALFICYIGISYQLPGAVTGERANLLTAHLKAMGLGDSARVISWHLSISAVYLPAWIIVSLVWHYKIFTGTNVGLVLVIHLLLGFSLASWSFFLAAPFGNSPQLSAIASTLLSFVFAILALVFSHASTGVAFIFTLIFPSSFYIFAIRAICGFEAHQVPTNAIHPDPDNNLRLIVLIIAAIINIFMWPYFAILWERRLYDAPDPSRSSWFRRRRHSLVEGDNIMPPDTAIHIQNLGKDYSPPFFSPSKTKVIAISDLSFSVPKFGIFVLLGSNGAGKSTALSIIAGLLGRTHGTILFEGGVTKPPRGTIGIVPQKNVLFPELTCYQTLRVWSAVKGHGAQDEDIQQLLRDCDLGAKIHANADKLSGGQKRKLQLAIGLIGGSKIVLVDECTSGVDPLSRRALWRTLSSVRYDRTIVFTTHFLDEADLLADNIAILAAPGKLVAQGSPVSLKSSLGQGYTVQAKFHVSDAPEKEWTRPSDELLTAIRGVAPMCHVSSPVPHQASYHLMSKDPKVVVRVLGVMDSQAETHNLESYDVLGTSIEDIFLDLMSREERLGEAESIESETKSVASIHHGKPLDLASGHKRSPLSQAFTIFHKRVLIARRGWLTPFLAVLVAVAGACVPLFFLPTQEQNCTKEFHNSTSISLFLPYSPLSFFSDVLVSPPNAIQYLGAAGTTLNTQNVTDNSTFVSDIQSNYRNLSLGGVSIDLSTGNSLFAWEASPPGINGPTLLNTVSNILYNSASKTTSASGSSLIAANYASFPAVYARTLVDLKWVAFYGAAMSVFPAFFSLYVSRERRSSVQAMQLSNGLANPVGLWLGHLMFDSLFSLFASTIIVIIFVSVSNQFHGLGFLWLILLLYGIVSALFSYCVSLIMSSPLSSFALSAGYQVIMFVLYLAGYLLTFTYAQSSKANDIVTIIHYTLSIASPVASVLRAAFVSVNLFSLLCDGSNPVTAASLGVLGRYGGPILYLIVYGLILFGILVWYDSGTLLPRGLLSIRNRWNKAIHATPVVANVAPDVEVEAKAVSSSHDSLRVLSISKAFGGNTVVDKVSFGVETGDVLALLGPNGAGKTTTFNIIRGDVIPDEGDVIINGVSVVLHPRGARLSLGVCPQFTAIDSQLTVREHLKIYGRLKGVPRGAALDLDVEALMAATSLSQYADRLASKLSGGNQRKLALAIAMMGNPANLLIDEFSTGIDAKTKRDMWSILRKIAVGKAVVITTHSMEEASALANKAGILATRMLAFGTIDSLAARYARYEVHFSCRTREEVAKAQQIMTRIPGAKLADDLATRFEVPMSGGGSEGMTLKKLFDSLSTQDEFTDFTVERATLESTFLKVIKENNITEESS